MTLKRRVMHGIVCISLGALGLLAPATPALATGPELQDVSPQLSGLSGLATLDAIDSLTGQNIKCTLKQDVSATLAVTANGLQESAITTSTSSCNATQAPSLVAYVLIEDLGFLRRTSSNAMESAGFTPARASASQVVPLTDEPGPQIRFTWISTLTTNANKTARICRTATVDITGRVSQVGYC